MSAFSEGKYTLKVVLADKAGRKLDEKTAPLYITRGPFGSREP